MWIATIPIVQSLDKNSIFVLDVNKCIHLFAFPTAFVLWVSEYSPVDIGWHWLSLMGNFSDCIRGRQQIVQSLDMMHYNLSLDALKNPFNMSNVFEREKNCITCLVLSHLVGNIQYEITKY